MHILFSQEVEFTSDKAKQEKGLKLIINNPDFGHILVVEKSNEIIASVNLLYSISTVLGAKVATIEDVIVLPTWQKKGVGSELLKYAIEFAKEHKCKRITLLSDKENFIAHKFYEKQGFKSSSMIPFRLSLG